MRWWSPLDIADDRERELALGQLQVRLARRGRLLRLAWRHTSEAERVTVELGEARPAEDVPEGWQVERVVAGNGQVRFAPAVADRPIVARPDVPFTVAPRAEVEVFVNTAVWCAIESGATLKRLPTIPPKPTWFGTNQEGLPCYAMRTHLRLEREQITRRDHRAIAPVRIVNEGDDPLRVDRVRIPAPNLPVHADATDQLWLPQIVLTRREGQHEAVLSRGRARTEPVLAAPLEPFVDNAVIRAFNSIFR